MPGTYEQFFAAIRQRESSNDYTAVNSVGFIGAYQFGEAALIDLGYVRRDKNPYDNNFSGGWTGKNGVDSKSEFLNSPAAQDAAAAEWWPLLWQRARNFDLEFYDQQTLNGVKLTKSGMIAASHLVGTGALKDFIESGGTVIRKDGNGTPITEYLTLFADYAVPASFGNNLEKANTIEGGARNDVLQGFEGDDVLVGEGGNDRLIGGTGNDTLRGGDGVDTAVFEGRQVDYNIVHNEDGSWTVSHVRGAKTGGSDTLIGIEQIEFSDRTNKLAVNSIETQVDFALVVDTTGSMGSYIGAVKAQMSNIVDALLQNGEIDARISIVGFKDPGETETILSFTDQDDLAARKAAAIGAIGGIVVGGGGDIPEGDNSGLLHSLTGVAGDYRDSAVVRRIALFTDAPVKDTELASEVARYASDIGASVASVATLTTSFGKMTTVTFAEVDGHIPSPVQIFTILVGFNSSAEESVREIAETNGGQFFDADNLSELTEALLEIINRPPNQAPVIVSDGGQESAALAIQRGDLFVTSIAAIDTDGDPISYAIAGGDDAAAFTVDPATGAVTFNTTGDGEIVEDADGDGVYDVIVSATDGRSFDSQQLTVSVIGEEDGITLVGGNGQDNLAGRSGNDLIYGGNGQDILEGRGGNDRLHGGNGSDHLIGGNGSDHLEGGQGSDMLEGGAGEDVFVFGRDDSYDTIVDFDPFEDSLLLTEGVALTGTDIIDNGADGTPDLVLHLSGGSSVILLGVSPFAELNIASAATSAAHHAGWAVGLMSGIHVDHESKDWAGFGEHEGSQCGTGHASQHEYLI